MPTAVAAWAGVTRASRHRSSPIQFVSVQFAPRSTPRQVYVSGVLAVSPSVITRGANQVFNITCDWDGGPSWRDGGVPSGSRGSFSRPVILGGAGDSQTCRTTLWFCGAAS